MDIKDLETFYKNLSPQKRKELAERLDMIDFATKINKDPEFFKEAIIELGKEYPLVKEYITNNKI